MFLLDANCWMQVVRQRSQAADVSRLLTGVPPAELAVTDYGVHSIGIVMLRHGTVGQYAAALAGLSIGTGVRVVTVPTPDLGRVADACTSYGLDFDDAYQYAAAELHGLALVSLDADFDRTPRGRLTPAAALAQHFAGQGTP